MPYRITPYNRKAALAYAKEWSFRRNPHYLDFTELGGDCTNFISQCLYAGAYIMNKTPQTGWFYISSYERSASWTGVTFLHRFLTTNTGLGPFGKEVPPHLAEAGDIIQFASTGLDFHHSLILIKRSQNVNLEDFLIATHSMDSYLRPLSSYDFTKLRIIHIDGVRFS